MMRLSPAVTTAVTNICWEIVKQINRVTSVTSVTSRVRTRMRARVMCS